MVERLSDIRLCKEVTSNYLDYFTFDEKEWFDMETNFAYIEDKNVGFAEKKGPGNSYWVHFCFHTARGRKAIELTKKMVEVLYEDTCFSSLVGLIHVDNKPAKWVIRQVGFKSAGPIDTENGPCEMFILTGKDFNNGL